MDMSELLPRLENVRKNGDGFTARCPAHDDAHNSLSVAERDGKLLLFCHAGCSFKDVIRALGINGGSAAIQSFERVWDVPNSSGEVVATHHRLDTEDGKKVWWTRNGAKGLAGLKTESLPLYGLKWLLAEPVDSARDIFIVEGEPAADALHEAGYLALATVTGAGGTPSKASLAPLLGRKGRIILWPDNDQVGRDHMGRIAGRLHEMGIACYMLEWASAPEHGDAVDFIRGGGDMVSLINNNVCIYNASLEDQHKGKCEENVRGLNANASPNVLPGKVSLAEMIRGWVEQTTGWWQTDELDRDLGVSSVKDKNNRRFVLHDLKSKGIIEAHPKLNKQWRYINTRVTSLDFKVAQKTGALPVRWPLGIEKFVNIFPGNLAVVAGSPNAGKTALLLNFIYLNDSEFPIYYFCSEMGEVELRDRLEQFPGMDVAEWKFQAFERASDFADVMVPDAVNVVDYLEMTDELYNVNKHLTAIQQKLESGIAIVAIQKKLKADFGRGQEFGLEKPKLYLSLDAGRLKIVKGKSWARKGVNPNGLRVDFKITDGCLFDETSTWTSGA